MIGSGPLKILFPTDYVKVYNCNFANLFAGYYTTTGTALPASWITHDQTEFTVDTDSKPLKGDYTILLRSTLTEDPETPKAFQEHSFKLTLTNPCDVTVLGKSKAHEHVAKLISNVTTTVAIDVTRDATTTDTSSWWYGPVAQRDGLTFCGARSYALSGNNSAFISLTTTTFTNDTIKVSTLDKTIAGVSGTVYVEELEVCLVDFCAACAVPIPCYKTTFSVTINPCIITDFYFTAGPVNKVFTVYSDFNDGATPPL